MGNADYRNIFATISNMNKYDITHNIEGMDGRVTNPESTDYILSSNGLPKIKGRQIHMRHGHSYFPLGPSTKTKSAYIKNSKKFHGFRAYCDIEYELMCGAGFPKEKIMLIGSLFPLEPLTEKIRSNFLIAKGQNPDKKTVLYAPTWGHGDPRGFFVDWFADGKEKNRVEELCKFITYELGYNFIIRFHERARYSNDFLGDYRDIFEKYSVFATYSDYDRRDEYYIRAADITIGDGSSVLMHSYLRNIPVIHIGKNPFKTKRAMGVCGIHLEDRPGYICKEFAQIIPFLKDAIENPNEFLEERKTIISKAFKYTGKKGEEALRNEMERICPS